MCQERWRERERERDKKERGTLEAGRVEKRNVTVLYSTLSVVSMYRFGIYKLYRYHFHTKAEKPRMRDR